MRKITELKSGWTFSKEENAYDIKQNNQIEGETVALPHTWNALDGQDGGNDYYRGTCWYQKELVIPEYDTENEEVWIEFSGAAMRAKVYFNGELAGKHDGGYSTFRVNVTEYLKDANILTVSTDNAENNEVYPQKADFTFYGGLYREVRLLIVPKSHFALNYFGGNGLKVTPKLEGNDAEVAVEAWTENVVDGCQVQFEIVDADGKLVDGIECEVHENHSLAALNIKNVHLWNGLQDPYQYKLRAILGGDIEEVMFGCREFCVDPEKGFFLNGKSYPLCGAARHQDRQGVGNALTKEMQDEDMEIMREMGVNTIRLAHYQHSQYFYDLCDRYGMIVWAEIPYITMHMPTANANSISQMTELVVQNYHHPSIICWALSNEITTVGGVSDDLIENHKALNDLCHRMDSTRLTTMANVFILSTDESLVNLPDIRSYNLYNGWYVGEKEDNDVWFDEFHQKYPDTVIGLSEYGADANPQYQSANPEKGDYTESYQAVYHEHMLQMWSERPFIWAMHVWNMFDFAADGRTEGGKPGQNQKGLVTFDRTIKKDAFYIYKAYLSKEKFVHLCGSRYVDRVESETEIKVYSNQPEVSLYMDGELVETKNADKVFAFHVAITGEHTVKAVSGACTDEIKIRKVEVENTDYIYEGREVNNWFDEDMIEVREGYFSIKDTLKDIKACPQSAALYNHLMSEALKAYGDVAKNVQLPPDVVERMDAMSLEENMKMAGHAIKAEMKIQINKALSQIKKPE